MGRKKRQEKMERDFRINIKIRNEEELLVYREIKALAAKRGLSLHDVVFEVFRKETHGK